MPSGRRFSSKTFTVLACTPVFALAGCTGVMVNDVSPPQLSAPAPEITENVASTQPVADAGSSAVPVPAQKPGSASGEPDPGIDTTIQTAAYDSARKPAANTAWCRYLEARAEARKSMLYSPTVSGSVDNDASASLKVSYDLMDIRRAGLESQTAKASCLSHEASGKIAQMLFVTPQSLTYAGNLQKANYLHSRRDELSAIAARIRRHVEAGEMTSQLAAGLNQYIETVRSLEHHARAEAHRRETVGVIDPGSMRGLNAQLSESERTLQQIDRRLRTLEAMSLTVAAGVNRRDGDDGSFFNDDSTYARVSFSYRLGAASPRRAKYEDEAERARVDALNEHGLGVLWRSTELALALKRAREGLQVQRDAVKLAIAEAQSNAAKFARGYEIELYQSTYRAQIDVIKLTSDLRGIEGTLADIDRLEKNLRFE